MDKKFKKSNYKIEKISYNEAMDIVVREHYLHRRAPCSHAFGLFEEDRCVGVVVYGTPSSAPLRRGIAGDEYANHVVELTRLWCHSSVPRNGESFLIGNTIKYAGKPIIVSYADASQGHVGYVYQATNWIYTGLSAKRTNWTVAGMDKHCQTIADKFTAKELREQYGDDFTLQPRARKHRYVFINENGKNRKKILAALRYPPQPYPKGLAEVAEVALLSH
jgi:hypothetical protein